jgi:hypothetical protein
VQSLFEQLEPSLGLDMQSLTDPNPVLVHDFDLQPLLITYSSQTERSVGSPPREDLESEPSPVSPSTPGSEYTATSVRFWL